jgi:hypothetical protein
LSHGRALKKGLVPGRSVDVERSDDFDGRPSPGAKHRAARKSIQMPRAAAARRCDHASPLPIPSFFAAI